MMIDQYGGDLMDDLATFSSHEVCSSVGLCGAKKAAAVSAVATSRRLLAER